MTMVSTVTSPIIGIVTVLYNSEDVLADFFSSLAQQRGVRFRLYVIENSATDAGLQLARHLAQTLRVEGRFVFNNANVGVAKGNNQGIDLALADGCSHVLLANNDTQFGPDTIRLLMDSMQAGQRAATPKIMYHGEPTLLWYGGGHISKLTVRTPHYGIKQQDRRQFDHQQYVGYAPTCFMMLDASVFSAIGRMDENYFVYYDDTDFVWRMQVAGVRIRYVPASVVLHKVSTSTGGENSPFSVYYTNRNRVYFVRKNYRGSRRLLALGYILLTRIPRLTLMQPALRRKGWNGIVAGFRMALPEARP